jgi:hypothetical protein
MAEKHLSRNCREAAYYLPLQHRTVLYHSVMAIRETGGEHGIPSVAVLVNGPGGGELTAVHETLTRVLRIPSVLVENADLAAVSLSLDPDSGILTVGGRRVRPAVLWIRHCGPGTLVTRADPPGSLSALDAACWSGMLEVLRAAAGTALPGPAPAGTVQLRQARRLGVRTPRTVLTTDVAAAARQIASPRVIVKVPDFRLVEPDPGRWAPHLPVVLDAEAAPGYRTPPGRPVVLQEYVEHADELRVFLLHGTLCAFRIGKRTPAALWTDPAGVTVTRVDCPPAAAAAVRTLANGWGLRYAAFDLLVTYDSEVVFLEANPDGDWLFFERKARWHGISLLAGLLVRELFLQGTEGTGADERAAA